MSANPRIARHEWQGKAIWLIGASKGIGLALAQDLSKLGANLILTARDPQQLQHTCDQLPACTVGDHTFQPEKLALAADFTDASAMQQAWEDACRFCQQLKEYAVPHPAMVIVNAGTYENMPAKRFDLPRALHQINVNVSGPLTVLSQVLPSYTNSQSGHIVLVSSVAGYRALPRALVYGSSKAALSYMAETLYLELAHKGTAVTVVHPGFVETPLTADNRFYMPALQTTQQASTAIIKGLQAGAYDIHFPKRFTLFLKLLKCLPRSWYMFVLRKTM